MSGCHSHYNSLARASMSWDSTLIDPEKVDALNEERSYIRHVAATAVAEEVGASRLQATTDFARVEEAEAVILCVSNTTQQEPRARHCVRLTNWTCHRSAPAQRHVGCPRINYISRHNRRRFAPCRASRTRERVPAVLFIGKANGVLSRAWLTRVPGCPQYIRNRLLRRPAIPSGSLSTPRDFPTGRVLQDREARS